MVKISTETNIIDKTIKAIDDIDNVNPNEVNSYIRTLLGLKAIKSSIPYSEGSRTVTLLNGHKTFGTTAIYTNDCLNLLTVHICSSELDEDIALLNKPLKSKLKIEIDKKIPSNYKQCNITTKYVKKGTILAKGPNEFDIITAPVSGSTKRFINKIKIKTTKRIGTGTKIQNLFLQKHVIKTDLYRFRFTNDSVSEETIKNMKCIKLKPEYIDMTSYKQPTLIVGSNSIFKRRAAGHLAQNWLGMQKLLNKPTSLENEWDKTVYLTKVYDVKTQQKYDAIVGINCWLISITSNDFEWKIGSPSVDMIGRHKNAVSIDPFAFKVLKYYNEGLSNGILKYQLEKRKETIQKYIKENL